MAYTDLSALHTFVRTLTTHDQKVEESSLKIISPRIADNAEDDQFALPESCHRSYEEP